MDVAIRHTTCLVYNASDPYADLLSTGVGNDDIKNDDLLQCLNDEKAFLYIPVIVFLGVLTIIGTLGNTLVLCVYWRKTYKSSSHYFILTLAALDLFSCLVGLPTEIADLRFPYMFDLPIACKLLRFTHSSTIIASSTILIQVAFDRYYRICKLGQQFSVSKAKMLCVMSVILGILTSWPTCLIFGRKTLNLHVLGPRTVLRMRPATGTGSNPNFGDDTESPPLANINSLVDDEDGRETNLDLVDSGVVSRMPEIVLLKGSDCSTEDSMRGTIYPTIYYLFLFSLFFITVAFFAVLYTRIGVAIWRRKRKTIGSKLVFTKVNSNGSDQASTEMSSEAEGSNPEHHNHHSGRLQNDQDNSKSCDSRSTTHQPPARTLAKHKPPPFTTFHYPSKSQPLLHFSAYHAPSSKVPTPQFTPHHPPPRGHVPTLTPDPKSSSLPVLEFSQPYPLPGLTTAAYLHATLTRPGKKAKDVHDASHLTTLSSSAYHGGTLPRGQKDCKGKDRVMPCPQPPAAYLTGTLPRKDKNRKGKEAEAEMTHHNNQKNGGGKRREIRVGKTTTVLFAVTLAYILSFLPYLVVMVLRSTIKDFEGRLSPVGEVAYKFCVKSFFINNAINPLIYSFLNASFRKDASKTLRQLWHQCCCTFVCCRCCCCTSSSRRRGSSSAHGDGCCCSGGRGGCGGCGNDDGHESEGKRAEGGCCCCCSDNEEEDRGGVLPHQNPIAV